MTEPVAGWYRDPGDDRNHRWWDGRRWTTTTRRASDAVIGGPGEPASSPPAAGAVGPTAPAAPWATPGATPPTPAPPWPPTLGATASTPARAEPVGRRRATHVDRRLVAALVIGVAVIVVLALVMIGSGHRSSRADATLGTSATSAGPTGPTQAPSASVPPTTQPSAQVLQAGHQYLAAVAVLNQAQRVFATGVAALAQDPTDSQVAALAAPYAQALDDFDQALLGLSLPPSIESERDDLVASNGVVRDDLQAVGNVGDIGTWSDQFTYDLRESNRDAAHLRAALHLPPNPAGQGPTI